MRSEDGAVVDLTEVAETVDQADVFLLAFPNFSDRLLVDSRVDRRVGPLIQVVESVGSFRERISWLRRHRPSLGVPEGFNLVNWPHSTSFLVESGIWERIRGRVNAAVAEDVQQACEFALDQLRELELQAMLDAISGVRHVTLWPRSD